MPVVSAINKGESPETIRRSDPRLFNMSDLARVLGVSRGFINQMKRQGFKMPMGRATIEMALSFIEKSDDSLDKAG